MSSSEPARLFFPSLTLSYSRCKSTYLSIEGYCRTNFGKSLHNLIRVFKPIHPTFEAPEHLLLNARFACSVPRVMESLQDLLSDSSCKFLRCCVDIVEIRTPLVDDPISILVIEPSLTNVSQTQHLLVARQFTCTSFFTVF